MYKNQKGANLIELVLVTLSLIVLLAFILFFPKITYQASPLDDVIKNIVNSNSDKTLNFLSDGSYTFKTEEQRQIFCSKIESLKGPLNFYINRINLSINNNGNVFKIDIQDEKNIKHEQIKENMNYYCNANSSLSSLSFKYIPLTQKEIEATKHKNLRNAFILLLGGILMLILIFHIEKNKKKPSIEILL